jgi:hypothetical protein
VSEPVQRCTTCGRYVIVTPDGRGFPPDIAKRKLQRLCKAGGCPSTPQYTAGIGPELLRQLAAASRAGRDSSKEGSGGWVPAQDR